MILVWACMSIILLILWLSSSHMQYPLFLSEKRRDVGAQTNSTELLPDVKSELLYIVIVSCVCLSVNSMQ